MSMPLKPDLPAGSAKYAMNLEVNNFSAERLVMGQKVEAAALRVRADNQGYVLRGDVNEFGVMLGEAWKQKRRMSSRISTPLIDEAFELAMGNGALGGKVTGAGGGGYMLFCCEFERRHLVAEQLLKLGLTVSELGFSRHGLTTWRGHE